MKQVAYSVSYVLCWLCTIYTKSCSQLLYRFLLYRYISLLHQNPNWYILYVLHYRNTYHLPFENEIPKDIDERERRQIVYYQWVPIIFMVWFQFKFLYIYKKITLRYLRYQSQHGQEPSNIKPASKQALVKVAII